MKAGNADVSCTKAALGWIFDVVPVNTRDTPCVGALVGDSSPLMLLCASGDLHSIKFRHFFAFHWAFL